MRFGVRPWGYEPRDHHPEPTMNNPWYNEVNGSTYGASQWDVKQPDPHEALRLQTEQMNVMARASGIPTGPNGQPQYQTFAPAQHPGFDPGAVLRAGLIWGLFGLLIDLFRLNRYEQRQQEYREERRVRQEKYIAAHEAWDREYGDAHRQGLPTPPAPTYQSAQE